MPYCRRVRERRAQEDRTHIVSLFEESLSDGKKDCARCQWGSWAKVDRSTSITDGEQDTT